MARSVSRHVPDGFYRAAPGVIVTVNQPLAEGVRSFPAELLGTTYDGGKLLSFRVRDGHGVTWFVPQDWTPPGTDLAADRAGVPMPMLRPGAFVDAIEALTKQWADRREGVR